MHLASPKTANCAKLSQNLKPLRLAASCALPRKMHLAGPKIANCGEAFTKSETIRLAASCTCHENCIVVFTRPYLNICLNLNICQTNLPPQGKNLLRFDCATATICFLWHMELHISTSVTKAVSGTILRRDQRQDNSYTQTR